MIVPKEGDVVQFVENHKWCGAFGFVREMKKCGADYRVMIGATMPDNQLQCTTAYIYSMLSEQEFEIVGRAVMLPPNEEDEDDDK